MKCPHCLTGMFRIHGRHTLDRNGDAQPLTICWQYCSECGQPWIELRLPIANGGGAETTNLLWPRHPKIPELPDDVPTAISSDFFEAHKVLVDSPKASAALSRRCLQNLLRDHAQTKSKDLADQIDEVKPTCPSYVWKLLHAVRHIGNFGAHPIKSTNSGEIIDVEPGEAEISLEALAAAIDHYIVKPVESNRKFEQVNDKLKETNKPQMTL